MTRSKLWNSNAGCSRMSRLRDKYRCRLRNFSPIGTIPLLSLLSLSFSLSFALSFRSLSLRNLPMIALVFWARLRMEVREFLE